MNLYPYQITGSKFLAGRRWALLADTMGLGKTAQAICAADAIKAMRILIICPAIVRVNWQREFQKFSHLARMFCIVTSAKDLIEPISVIICSYELASKASVHARLMRMKFDVIIIDEAHFLKNRLAKRTTAIYGLHCKGDSGLMSRAERIWALTGTPTPNHPGEIYSLLRAFGIWKENYFAFEDRFCVTKPGDYGSVVVGMKNVPELKKLVEPIMLRRKTEDVLPDLPPISYSDVVLSPFGISHPDDVLAWQNAEEEKDAKNLKLLAEKLQNDDPAADAEMANLRMPTLRRITGIAKIRPVAEWVARELDAGLDKIVLFGIHRDVLMGLRDTLSSYNPVLVFGGTNPETKQKRIDNFVDIYKYRVFIGQVQAAGTGIDGLQKSCCTVGFVESSWNPMENAQAAMRVRRMGQTRRVDCRFFSLADSLDEVISTTIRRKTEMISQLLD